MNRNLNSPCKNWKRKRAAAQAGKPAIAGMIAAVVMLISVGCSSDKGDKEPTVSVQVAAVEKTTIERTINTQAILSPRQQAAIVPKISAPVQKFLVRRGSPVHVGQLLAVLENRDLSAAAQDTEGTYKQQEALHKITTAASLPEEIKKAEADVQQAQLVLDAQEKIFRAASSCSIRARCQGKNSISRESTLRKPETNTRLPSSISIR